MNVIIIDLDCKKFFSDKMLVQNLLHDLDCSIYELKLEQNLLLEEGCRCVLITSLKNGVQDYHRKLILQYPQVNCWVFSIVNVSFESEKVQIRDNLEMVLAQTKVKYQVVFDTIQTLEKTAKICKTSIRLKKLCLVVSQNAELAKECCKMLGYRLQEWDVISGSEHSKLSYEDADIILAVGNKPKDYELLPPLNCMGRIYVWVEQNGFYNKELVQSVYEKLMHQKWNLGSTNKIYSSNLQMELYAWKIEQKELSIEALKNIEEFVIWDMYGLPIQNQDYTQQVVETFIQQQCCFGTLTKKLKS